jgi:hypothetical protein
MIREKNRPFRRLVFMFFLDWKLFQRADRYSGILGWADPIRNVTYVTWLLADLGLVNQAEGKVSRFGQRNQVRLVDLCW